MDFNNVFLNLVLWINLFNLWIILNRNMYFFKFLKRKLTQKIINKRDKEIYV